MSWEERLADHPRLVAARADLAAESLRGRIAAPRYSVPEAARVVVPVAPLLRAPAGSLDTELLFGEPFEVLDRAEGHAWGRAPLDGYVGYVPEACLGAPGPEPTHRVSALRSHVYPEPNIKTRPLGWLPFGARVAVAEAVPEAGEKFAPLASGGFVPVPHLAPLDRPAADWVAEAERFLGIPYLWGGRSTAGCDCSSLVQLSRQAAGLPTPRDSDMQEAALGDTIGGNVALRRGDLIFWIRHVGIMLDGERLLHANATHMATVIEPLAVAEPRIEAAGNGVVTRRARLDATPDRP